MSQYRWKVPKKHFKNSSTWNSDTADCTFSKIYNLSSFCKKYPFSSLIIAYIPWAYFRIFIMCGSIPELSNSVAILARIQVQRLILVTVCLTVIWIVNVCPFVINKIDTKFFSETYLDSSIPSDDDNLELPGYNLVLADDPTNTKRGGVCIYYHNSLPLKVIDIQFLNECINFEKRISRKLCSFLCLYRSSS